MVPPLFAFVAFFSRWQSNQRRENAGRFRARGALRNALRLRSAARKQMGLENPVPFYGALHAALANFLADKLGSRGGRIGLGRRGTAASATQHRSGVARRVRSLLEEADMARFAPSALGGESRAAALAAAQQTLKALNEGLK